jgi:hypothetical protein
MKVTVIHFDKEHGIRNKKIYQEFIKFLQDILPIKNDVTINLLNKRIGDMTTGSRSSDNTIKVLTKGRINRDILRTLAHEWVHEYQRTILNRGKGPDIGGKNEDEANAFAGSILKKFEKKFPNFEEKMYE